MEQTSPGQTNTSSSEHDSTNQKVMAVLAYLGILIIIPFLMAKNDPFVKYHIKQGLVLVVIEIIVWFIGGMMFWQLWQFLQLINLATLILAIIGIVNVINHKESELPLVGQFARHFNF
jgi:uncharacterized membrane protein